MSSAAAAVASAPVRTVLDRLKGATWKGGQWIARCPAHDDRTPSLTLRQGNDGRALLHCHAGCALRSIVGALGLTMGDIFPEGSRAARDILPVRPHAPTRPAAKPATNGSRNGNANGNGNGTHAAVAPLPAAAPVAEREPERESERVPRREVARYDYVDESDALLYQVARMEPKTFRQRRPDGRGGWSYTLGDVRRVLYRLPDVLEAVALGRPVLLVEGEKDAETARALGYVATTNAGGAKNWRAELAAPLAGGTVTLLPDNDEPGRAWALAAAADVAATGAEVRILALPGLAPKGDLSDWVAAGGTARQLGRLIERAPVWRAGDPIPSAPAPSRFRVFSASELAALPPMAWLVDEMLPAAGLAAIYGKPGSGKSFLTVDLVCSVATGLPCLGRNVRQGSALYVAAEGVSGLPQRVAAWAALHGVPADAIPGAGFVTEAANLMDDADVQHIVRAFDALDDRNGGPPRLVIFDTLHRSMPGGEENSAKDVGLVLARADRVRQATGATILVVHHTRKDEAMERGSTALRGAVDTLLLVKEEVQGRRVYCEKQKDAAPFPPVRIELTAVRDSCAVTLPAAGEPTETLTPTLRAALLDLARSHLDEGASASEWLASSQLAPSTFYRARSELVRAGLVTDPDGKRGARYALTPSGRFIVRAIDAGDPASLSTLAGPGSKEHQERHADDHSQASNSLPSHSHGAPGSHSHGTPWGPPTGAPGPGSLPLGERGTAA